VKCFYQPPITVVISFWPFENIKERDTYPNKDDEPFWQLDEEIGEGRFFDQPAAIRLKAHVSHERDHRSDGDEIVPLRHKSGTRLYVMAKPYILEPDYRLTIGLYPQPTTQGAIGEVTGSDWVGMRQRVIGNAQAWLYPQERILILWECFLEDQYRQQDPRIDGNLKAIWFGFERFVLRTLPRPIQRIVTPSWEPLYDGAGPAWTDFLEAVGYRHIGSRAYCKRVTTSAHT
jgi:hypothetical protein